MTLFINLYPGSEIVGVPASEINVILNPDFNIFTNLLILCSSLNL